MDTKNYLHKCIKSTCQNTYSDNDPDAYYCEDCRKENKRVAEMIDAKLKSQVKKRKSVSLLDEYNSLPKGRFGYPIFK